MRQEIDLGPTRNRDDDAITMQINFFNAPSPVLFNQRHWPTECWHNSVLRIFMDRSI